MGETSSILFQVFFINFLKFWWRVVLSSGNLLNTFPIKNSKNGYDLGTDFEMILENWKYNKLNWINHRSSPLKMVHGCLKLNVLHFGECLFCSHAENCYTNCIQIFYDCAIQFDFFACLFCPLALPWLSPLGGTVVFFEVFHIHGRLLPRL